MNVPDAENEADHDKHSHPSKEEGLKQGRGVRGRQVEAEANGSEAKSADYPARELVQEPRHQPDHLCARVRMSVHLLIFAYGVLVCVRACRSECMSTYKKKPATLV